MKIVLLAPTHKSFISSFLQGIDKNILPEGYFGAPFLSDIIEGLLGRGHEVIAITTSFSDNIDFTVKTFQNGNFTWVVVPMRKHAFRLNAFRFGRMLDFYALERKQIMQQLKQYQPDIVHAHWGYEFAHCAVSSGLPNLVTIHDNPYVIIRYQKSLYRVFKLIYAAFLFPKIKYSSTVSPYMMKYASSNKSQCRLIPNPIRILYTRNEVMESIEKRAKTLFDKPNFVMIINGWDKRKNGRNGLLAFKKIQSTFSGATLHLFGRGTEEGGPAQMDGLGLKMDNVIYHGMTDRSQLISTLKEMHILIHTALEESFGVVLIEAMSLGVPAIGGRQSGAVPWVISDDNLLTDVREPSQIAETVKSSMDNFAKLSLSCYDNVAARFSAEKVTEQYENYYFDICRG
jgi:glycosyltransferase involved in cell wall biosynthesis